MFSATGTHYDEESKIWQGPRVKHYFGADVTLGEAALFALSRNPTKVIQVMDTTGEQLTAGQLVRESKLMARSLLGLGLKKGDIVCLPVYNSTQLSAVVMGAFLCGLPTNAIHPKSDKEFVKHIFAITKPKLIVCEMENYFFMKAIVVEMKLEAKVLLLRGDIKGATHVSELLKDDGSDLEYMRFPCASLNGDDTAIILNSSGTTGASKCICCSHKALLNRQRYTDARLDDVLFSFSNLSWALGIFSLTKSFLNCIKRIITDRDFSVDYFYELIRKHNITHVMVMPRQLIEIACKAQSSAQNLASVRTLYASGAKVAGAVTSQLNALLDSNLESKVGAIAAYGMAEVASLISLNDGGPGQRREGTEGKLYPNTDVRIVGKNGELLGINEIGLLHVRTACKWAGYYGAPELTRKAYQNGWIITGDLAYFDADGYLHVCGRESDVFLCGGIEVFAVLLESAIMEVPGVMEACVFQVPEKDLTACAIIHSNDEAGQSLDAAAILARVTKLDAAQQFKGGIYFVHNLPRTYSGKVQRAKVWPNMKASSSENDANNNENKCVRIK